jgi:hypothetical protein
MGVNPQVSSIFNGRLMDLWRCGVVQFIHDPHGELASQGFEADVHYVPFDGTPEDVVRKAKALRKSHKRMAEIMRAGYEACHKYQTERSTNAVFAQIYGDHLGQIEHGR